MNVSWLVIGQIRICKEADETPEDVAKWLCSVLLDLDLFEQIHCLTKRTPVEAETVLRIVLVRLANELKLTPAQTASVLEFARVHSGLELKDALEIPHDEREREST